MRRLMQQCFSTKNGFWGEFTTVFSTIQWKNVEMWKTAQSRDSA
jgi:hypothetical protein